MQPTVRANQMQERSHMTGELCKECNQRTAQVQRVRGLMYNVANGMFYFLFVSLVNAHPNLHSSATLALYTVDQTPSRFLR